MDWVDLIIALLVLFAAVTGWAEGAIRRLAHVLGLAVGFFAMVAWAPGLSGDITHAVYRPLLALALVGVGSVLGGVAGHAVGGIVARALRAVQLGPIDRGAGVVVGTAASLVGCWLVAGLLASTTWGSVATEIQDSRILRGVDAVMPALPSVEQRVQTLMRQADLPAIFAQVIAPSLSAPVAIGRLPASKAPVGSPVGVEKVLAIAGCATTSEGTAFFVTPALAVTNAHVVAGHRDITVGGVAATVVAYDAQSDLAVLRVRAAQAPLITSTATPAKATRLSVVGFPLDASRTLTAAYMEGTTAALSRDIYGNDLAVRTFLVLEAQIEPGNSGSPVLDGGQVVGVVESMSASQAATAYAIPFALARPLYAHAGTRAVSTGACLN